MRAILGGLFLSLLIAGACQQATMQSPGTTTGAGVCYAKGAPFVLGQLNFTSVTSNNGQINPSAQTMSGPSSTYCIYNQVYVSDTNNSRVLIWNSMPGLNGQSANSVLGQSTMIVGTANQGSAVSGQTLSNPNAIFSDGIRLFVADTNNNRILIWDTLPTTTDQIADTVIGQLNLTSGGSGVTSTNLHQPMGVFADSTHVYVADTSNNRVLIWNTSTPGPTTPADLVLGQTDFVSSGANDGSSTVGMANPTNVFSKNGKLFVADRSNNRVLVWNSMPTVNGQSADFAIGQTSLSTTNFTSTSSSSLEAPSQVTFDGTWFYAADKGSNRILEWNFMPASYGDIPTLVFGQLNFVTSTAAAGSSGVSGPSGVFSSGASLFISDQGNNRILIISDP